MLPPHLEKLEDRLRIAARLRRYEEVGQLAAEFGLQMREYVRSLPQGDSRGADAARTALDTYSWALVMMQAARASCLAELRRVVTANRYAHLPAGAEGATHVRIDG